MLIEYKTVDKVTSEDGEGHESSRNPIDALRRKVSDRIEGFDRTKAIDTIITSPNRIQRELKSLSATGLLTRFPLATVLLCILLTILLGAESGMNDR